MGRMLTFCVQSEKGDIFCLIDTTDTSYVYYCIIFTYHTLYRVID